MRTSLVASLVAAAALSLPGTALALGTPGEVDPSFHGGAPVLIDLAKTVPRRTGLSGILVDGAGRIVVAGDATDANGNSAVALARLDSAGTLDPSFGEGGGSVVQFGAGTAPNQPYSSVTDLFAVPGRYVGVGVFRRRQGRSDLSAYVIGQSGSGDLGFGNAGPGFSTVDPFPAPYEASLSGVAAGSDGSIIMAGTEMNSTSPYISNMAIGLDPQGVHQPSDIGFGFYDGRAGYDNSFGGPVTFLPGGKVLVTGTAELVSGFGVALARISPSGVDSSFGDGEGIPGSTVVNFSDAMVSRAESSARAVAVAPDGAIYVAGEALDIEGERAALLARFTPSGRLDYSFGSSGFRRIQLGGPEQGSSIASIVLQPDGKIVAIADVTTGLGVSSPRILRFDEDGSLDPTFGDGGQVIVNLGGTESSLSSGTIQDGQLLVAGSRREGSVTDGVVTRYLLGPLPDPPPATTKAEPGPSPSAAGTGSGKASGPAAVGSLRISAKRLSVDRKGHVAVPLACSAVGPCAGAVAIVAATGRLTGPKRKRAVTFAQAKYALAAGAKKSLRLTLSGSARTHARGKAGLKTRLAIEPHGSVPTLSALKLHR
jgi:uncharacterized delta-60 repeat protein